VVYFFTDNSTENRLERKRVAKMITTFKLINDNEYGETSYVQEKDWDNFVRGTYEAFYPDGDADVDFEDFKADMEEVTVDMDFEMLQYEFQVLGNKDWWAREVFNEIEGQDKEIASFVVYALDVIPESPCVNVKGFITAVQDGRPWAYSNGVRAEAFKTAPYLGNGTVIEYAIQYYKGEVLKETIKFDTLKQLLSEAKKFQSNFELWGEVAEN
jgi:hypothetical protein